MFYMRDAQKAQPFVHPSMEGLGVFELRADINEERLRVITFVVLERVMLANVAAAPANWPASEARH